MEEKITLEFKINELNIIMLALGKMPYENVFQVVDNIRQQIVSKTNNSVEPPSTT